MIEGIDISTLKIKPEDTVIVTVDTDKWSVAEARQIHQGVTSMFPNNCVITTLDGVEIAVSSPEEDEAR